mmetsp:Transcript_80954/g.242507  ORF Transcript_80954/g.242507 Transcript_80954/m.242507 type:complete len:462 (+) Transcript_80954:1-1386(+)
MHEVGAAGHALLGAWSMNGDGRGIQSLVQAQAPTSARALLVAQEAAELLQSAAEAKLPEVNDAVVVVSSDERPIARPSKEELVVTCLAVPAKQPTGGLPRSFPAGAPSASDAAPPAADPPLSWDVLTVELIELILLPLAKAELQSFKTCSRAWCWAARRILCSPWWQITNVPFTEMLLEPELSDDVLLARLAFYGEGKQAGASHFGVVDANETAILHHAVYLRPALVPTLLRTDPWATTYWNCHGMLPLHAAVVQGAPDDVVVALVGAYPEAVHIQCLHKGFLPLHYAAMTASKSHALILLSGGRGRKQAATADRYGQQPLHVLATHSAADAMRQSGDPLGTATVLLQVYPEGIARPDYSGQLPLHKGFAHGANAPLMVALACEYPEAHHVRDLQGCTPEDLCLLREELRASLPRTTASQPSPWTLAEWCSSQTLAWVAKMTFLCYDVLRVTLRNLMIEER